MLNFYTGITTPALFEWFLSLFVRKVRYFSEKLSHNDHLLLELLKLKLGLLNKDLAYRFGLRETVASRIYRRWIPIISRETCHLIIWPDREALRRHLPNSLKKNFQNCTCIIDCTEIFAERPYNLNARAQTWSNYKNTCTMKYLIGITPAGAVSFLSRGYGGRISDKEITTQSGFLDKLQHGDCILADRGFTIAQDLATRGAYLKIPKFACGKAQMSASDVAISRKISNVRIHVERVIGRLRKFRILQLFQYRKLT
ncbi:uncharacterized protein LOC130648294 [Hydractinia symbiolongicarpus]|uniref:uncharacterized protein LOC130648294 n=1 Tax=Hydractinia symbiolongicarpus TaxID=13093 RepID=UPI00254EDE4A|nr:uncharacterized protein LOC130648294 [Hydractinia symbiolongicarpus]